MKAIYLTSKSDKFPLAVVDNKISCDIADVLSEKSMGEITISPATKDVSLGEGVTIAFFESGRHADFVGVFRDEYLYSSCAERLEFLAKKANMFVTEFCEVEDFELEEYVSF